MKIINPFNDQLIEEVQEDSAQMIREKFQNAKRAQFEFSQTSIDSKIASIKSFSEALMQKQDELAEVLTLETGKPISQSKGEISACPERIEFFLDHVKESVQEEVVLNGGASTSEKITYEPLGVVANISAWNYPYFVGTNVFIPALLTGNSVLYKPSEFATLTGLKIAELLHESGIPKDVFAPVIGGGAVGAALLDQNPDAVFFTGSQPTGVKIAKEVADQLLKLQLELGGKDPVYVAHGADPASAAVALADGAFYNCGQSCCAVERIYVHESLAEPFIQSFVQTVQDFVIGDPLDPKTYIGPLTRRAQMSVLEDQISDAQKKGAKVLLGGQPLNKTTFEPTVVSEVNHKMKLMHDESFGPVIGIQIVKSDEEAIRLMNDTNFGLTAGVFSKDRSLAETVLSQVHSGSVYWNCCDRVSPRLPWTGRNQSGLGSTLAREGIRTFTQPKAWHLRAP